MMARPNFVVILADDLEYSDLGCFNATCIKTPRVDRMADEGLKLTSFYVGAPLCSPSRASDYVNGHFLVVDGGYLVR